MFFRFVTKDGRTDVQTDGQTDRLTEGRMDRQNYYPQDRAIITASRGKNQS